MTRLVNSPIKITTDCTGFPQGFTWNNQWFKVTKLLERWVEAGEWWDGATELNVYRVVTHPDGVFEIHLHSQDSPIPKTTRATVNGLLYRVYD